MAYDAATAGDAESELVEEDVFDGPPGDRAASAELRAEFEEAGSEASSADQPVDADEEFFGGFAAPDAVPADAVGADDEEFVGGFAAPPPVTPPAVENVEPDEPRELELLVPDKTFPPLATGGVRVSFDDLDLLKVLNAEPVPADVVSHLPDWLAGLDGERVRLRGFMYPTYADPVERFVLARDNQICCFGRSPKPYDLVTVVLAEGAESSYIQNRPFDVAGTFRLDPVHDGDSWLRLYRIDDARVID